jgi:glycosyltransferase involved in cell wall biosynthesis
MSTSPGTRPEMKKAPVSCYIRTLNEERLIKAVIDSALTVVDEVIIVDSGSKDRTIEIAKACGARVLDQPWLGWGFQKRAGEDACRNDWVLDLDADEVLTPELAREISDLFASGTPPTPVWRMRLVTAPPVGEPWYNVHVVQRNKLYDRRVIRMPEDRAWDQLRIPAGAAIADLKGSLLHFSIRDIAHVVEKMNGASSSMAKDGKKKSPATIRLRVVFGPAFYFFKAYIMRGLWRAGLYGLIQARLSSMGRWLRDAKLYEAERMAAERATRDQQKP